MKEISKKKKNSNLNQSIWVCECFAVKKKPIDIFFFLKKIMIGENCKILYNSNLYLKN